MRKAKNLRLKAKIRRQLSLQVETSDDQSGEFDSSLGARCFLLFAASPEPRRIQVQIVLVQIVLVSRTKNFVSVEPARGVSGESQPHGNIVIHAMDAAVAWLGKVKLSGVRVEKVKAPKEEFLRHTAHFDKVEVQDASAPRLWARHYEIGTDRPVFAGRDGVMKFALAEIEREPRTGTPWYRIWPQKLIEKEYPQWRGQIAGGTRP